MSLQTLCEVLTAARQMWETHENARINSGLRSYDTIMEFVLAHPNALVRQCLSGHLTGSALVIDPRAHSLVLVHHRKLNLWLQPGGHADGESAIHNVALREAAEETGLTTLQIMPLGCHGWPLPFDVDIHAIPEHKGVPAHFHHDLRYLILADAREQPIVSEESHDVRWVCYADLPQYTAEDSILRMVEKYNILCN